MQCACPILSYVTCPDLQYFSTLSYKRHDFRKKKRSLNTKHVYTLITNLMHWLLFIHKILFSSTCFEHQVLIFRRIQLYTCSICVCTMSCLYYVYCVCTMFIVFVLCLLCLYYVYYLTTGLLDLDAGRLARSQNPEGPATGHLDPDFLGFPGS